MPQQCDEIDYRLIGEEMQAVVITLDPDEQVLAEAGTMLYMTDGIDMHDQPRAKLLKAIGAELIRAAGMSTGDAIVPTIDRAAAVLTKAQDLHDRVGVKTMLRGLDRARAAAVKGIDQVNSPVPETGNADTTPNDTD